MFSYRALRSLVSKNRPPQGTYQYGELYVNLADEQLGVIDENGIPQDLLAITFFKNLAHYSKGDHVIYQGKIYIAKNDIQGPKNFDPNDWSTSGIDLSIGDYDEELPYNKGHAAFFPGDNCFLQAIIDIPANTPFDEAMWEPICSGKGAGGGGGVSVGDIVTLPYMPDIQVLSDRRLVVCQGQLLPTVGEFADLFAVYQFKFGQGVTTAEFRLPDFRGYVPRGVDESLAVDPDADMRTGHGTNVGAMGGTHQDDQVGPHKHTGTLDEPANDWVDPPSNRAHGYVRNIVYKWWPQLNIHTLQTSENRMKNIGVHFFAQY